MRNQWQSIATLTAVSVSVLAYLNLAPLPAVRFAPINPVRVGPLDKGNGDAELSEVIEPLLVDRGNPVGVQTTEPPVDDGPLPPVLLEPGTQQPPRPDADPAFVPRMPYADEEEGLGLKRDPVLRIIDKNLPPLIIFEEFDKTNPAEESEPLNVPPLQMIPVPDYHHQHCPNHGGCPAPYRPIHR